MLNKIEWSGDRVSTNIVYFYSGLYKDRGIMLKKTNCPSERGTVGRYSVCRRLGQVDDQAVLFKHGSKKSGH